MTKADLLVSLSKFSPYVVIETGIETLMGEVVPQTPPVEMVEIRRISGNRTWVDVGQIMTITSVSEQSWNAMKKQAVQQLGEIKSMIETEDEKETVH